MRRSFWFTTVLMVALGGELLLRVAPVQAENASLLPPMENQGKVLSGSVNSAPFPDPSQAGQVNSAGQTKKQWVNPGERPSLRSGFHHPQGTGSPGPDESSSVTYGSHRSLGSLFELKRQETLLKREIAIKKLQKQLSGHSAKKTLDTGTKGSPMTLLAAGIDGNRYAVLSWPDGRKIRVREGERLPDGNRVIRIDGSGVSVQKRGSTETYPYGESSGDRQGGGIPQFSGFSPPPPPYQRTGGHP